MPLPPPPTSSEATLDDSRRRPPSGLDFATATKSEWSERGLSRMRFRRGLRLTSERARSLRVEKSRRRQLQSRAANFSLFRPTSSFVTRARNLVSSAVTQPSVGPMSADPLVAGNKCLGRTSMIVVSVALLPGPSSQSPSIKDDLELEEAQSLLHLLPSSFLLPLSSAGGVI